MISIIICSVKPLLLKQVCESIAATIGVQHEIIAIDNRESNKGICQVYNEGVAKAQYEVLCFIHEDIIIQTKNWGYHLTALFNREPDLGLVGIAGAGYMPLSPSTWGGVGVDCGYINIIQHYKFNRKKERHFYHNPNNEKLSYVAFLDGVWLSTTKKVATEFKFDETTFTGFHGYDLDFSLSVGSKYKLAVTYDILVKHLSEGNYDRTWMEENIKIFNKWRDFLPINVKGLSARQIFITEKSTYKHFVDQLIRFKLPLTIALKFLWNKNKFYSIDKRLLFKLNFFLAKRKLLPGTAKMGNL